MSSDQPETVWSRDRWNTFQKLRTIALDMVSCADAPQNPVQCDPISSLGTGYRDSLLARLLRRNLVFVIAFRFVFPVAIRLIVRRDLRFCMAATSLRSVEVSLVQAMRN
jgi:hypothetical protein